MRTIALLVLLLLGACRTEAALTLVTRETFQNVGQLDTGTPGNLGVVEATSVFYKRAVGPHLVGDDSAAGRGWSADFHAQTTHRWARHVLNVFSTAANNNGMFSCFYFIKGLIPEGNNFALLCSSYDYNGGAFFEVTIDPKTAHIWVKRGGDWVNRDTGILVPVNAWFELRTTWNRQHPTWGSEFLATLAFRTTGSSTWTSLQAGDYTFGERIKEFAGGLPAASGAAGFYQGRYGMPALYTSDNYAVDAVAALPDVEDPTGPTTWYMDPFNGNDNNDGLSVGTAWKSMAKLDAESENAGLFASGSYQNGDTVIIDTAFDMLDFQGGTLNLRTGGLTVKAAPGREYIRCKLYKSLANASFAKVGGLNHTWSMADASPNCVLWEADKWMNHPTGATWASVSATVDSTPGSFWTDGTTMYVHPFGDTDPTADGKRYERSYFGSTIQQWGSNFRLMDISAGKTCLAQPTDNDSLGGYCLGTAGTVNGTNLIKHCYFYYGSKHGLGLVADGSSTETTISDCQNEQCSPYYSQSPWVSFMTYNSSSNNVHIYTNCTTLMMGGLIGSTTGQHLGTPVLLSHNEGGAFNFRGIYLRNCNFPQGHVNLGVSTNCAVQGGTYGNFNNYNYFLSIEGANFLGVKNMAGNDVVVRSSIMAPTVAYGNGSGCEAISTVRFEGCVFDTRGIPSTDTPYRALIMRTGPTTMIFRDNIFICKSGQQFTVFGNFTSADTLMLSNNVYLLGSGNTIAWQYNDGSTTADRTLGAWQAYGFDANTVTHGLQFSGNGRPYSRFYFNQAAALGSMSEFGGKAFLNRNTVGAYEWQTPNPRLLLFHR